MYKHRAHEKHESRRKVATVIQARSNRRTNGIVTRKLRRIIQKLLVQSSE